ncbi:MAG: hypothetical protein QOK11_1043, partial [Pseudonocardiales bacterium]|nr:hypothetical protein [Pseudonocardiales bacterium]
DQVGQRLGDRRRSFRNSYRLNCVLRLMLLDLPGSSSVTTWTRILRDNHRRHAGQPPPRRHHDGKRMFVPRGRGFSKPPLPKGWPATSATLNSLPAYGLTFDDELPAAEDEGFPF